MGHWEGDTLVVDSIGFSGKSWVQSSMEPHTEETHMIERIRHITDEIGAFIEIVSTVEDRHALTSAYTYTRYYRKVAERDRRERLRRRRAGLEGFSQQGSQAAIRSRARGSLTRSASGVYGSSSQMSSMTSVFSFS